MQVDGNRSPPEVKMDVGHSCPPGARPSSLLPWATGRPETDLSKKVMLKKWGLLATLDPPV